MNFSQMSKEDFALMKITVEKFYDAMSCFNSLMKECPKVKADISIEIKRIWPLFDETFFHFGMTALFEKISFIYVEINNEADRRANE